MYLVRNPRIVVREMESEMVLLDREAGYVHHLNETASRLWAGFDGRTRTDWIVNDFVEHTDEETDRVRSDAIALINELRDRQLLLPRAATGPLDESPKAGGDHEQREV